MDIRADIINCARQWAFTPYLWGGDNELEGVDCSQFVINVLDDFGLFPAGHDTTSAGLWAHFKAVRRRYPIEAGLVFWRRADSDGIVHVGLLTGVRWDWAGNQKNWWVLEAAGPGRKVDSREDAVKYRAMVKERPLDHDRGLVIVGYADPLLIGFGRYEREIIA